MYFTSPVGWVAWCCMIPVPLTTPFFKRPVEFQTLVLGGGRPRKRNFCGIPRFFRRRAASNPPAEAASGPLGDHLGEPFDRGFVEHQPHRRISQLLAIELENAALADEPGCVLLTH